MSNAFIGYFLSLYPHSAYARLMQDMWFKASPLRSRAANPHEVKTTLARVHSTFAGYSQQDSQELLRLLLSELHEEMKANSKQDKSNKLVPITALRWVSLYATVVKYLLTMVAGQALS